VLGFLLVASFSNEALAQPQDCNTNVDACVRWAVAEIATFVDECGKLYPNTKASLDVLLSQWSVLKLPIPELEEALNPKSESRVALRDRIGPYLKGIPSYEREIECSGRVEILRSKEPALIADSVRLPKDVLRKYMK
jgi:hypothetical protein